jgi:TetR/AcrR family tetracycline transcriptional repressor
MVIEAAIQLADEEGLDQFSLRAVAARLGVAPMTLYGHVENADELIALVASDLIRRARHRFPEHSGADPIVRWANELRALLLEHPVILEALLREPVYSDRSMEAIERVLDVLVGSGFDEDTAVDLYALILAFVIGFCALEQGRERTRDLDDARRDEMEKRLDDSIADLPRLQRARGRALHLFVPDQFNRTLKALTDVIQKRHR